MIALYVLLGVALVVVVTVITCKVLGSAHNADKWTSAEIDKLSRGER
jgi:hypothetical protein